MLPQRVARWPIHSLTRNLRPSQKAPLPTRQLQLQLQLRSCSTCEATTPAASQITTPPSNKPSKKTPPPPPPAPEKTPPDHRTLGLHQKLFTTSIYSPGSAFFLPSGTRIFNRLVSFLRNQYVRYGFEEVITPLIYKKDLWAKSGHLENYAQDMYTVTGARHASPEETEETDREYGLKPMNCPGHCLIFSSQKRSFRDLPIRYADFSPLHRNENTGSLTGLTRVRRFHQDDGHIFCRPVQIEEEIKKSLEFVKHTYATLGLGPYRLALSTRPEQYIGSLEDWENAENALKRALDKSGTDWTVNEGDGAFYGPKIDIVLRDSHGKEHQTATIQLDFQLPKRFELEYIAPAPELEQKGETTTDPELLASFGPVRPVMIHRAVLGSVERLMALLIEHYDGKYPLWLNPNQIKIITLNDTEPVVEWATRVRERLLGIADGDVTPTHFAVDLDTSARPIAVKKAEAVSAGVSVVVTIGASEVEGKSLSVDISAVTGSRKRVTMGPEELRAWVGERVAAHE
ncbi:threonyl-tRNA synthetase [Podospora bellae-mahoneyi]|uniref:threonine--tRNA ligase n=1 Tax=Podospora bellae-mahoneyi TaxID=2093777 RepID=A0ABR0FXR0_9PEZI|nr:threonyl-tRNA synthetase [Podospora bellae-mahoneyi]